MIHAAGLAPYRVLPVGGAPEEAGFWPHDNLCPHVKRILDRALASDLPELAGVVFMASCDAMRRLADAWQTVRPETRLVVLDLPVADDPRSVASASSPRRSTDSAPGRRRGPRGRLGGVPGGARPGGDRAASPEAPSAMQWARRPQ
jgi:hypothetical protein